MIFGIEQRKENKRFQFKTLNWQTINSLDVSTIKRLLKEQKELRLSEMPELINEREREKKMMGGETGSYGGQRNA